MPVVAGHAQGSPGAVASLAVVLEHDGRPLCCAGQHVGEGHVECHAEGRPREVAGAVVVVQACLWE